ncbi:MAG: peptidoglycan bridge formation glycyltransferase FemA/FemB family protein [Novosphingobium sp.]|uniref:lipid II:glycine glycyltransferase FemX n=1 Tax=Novosphingobium sp. TaxID=1874826 RepID=UPI0027350AB2|nr:peptidoglycan bridge formation glycyltransferase FemA/FemB family protein [Novosphingobium sp.]MDP3549934.1 peptidoglycan bridge formation glycyltransferase FemA/FemB family protein [Novosphingobium sp.]
MPSEALLLDELDNGQRAVLDDFVMASPHAAYQQTSVWADIQKRQCGAHYRFFLYKQHGTLCATAVIREVRMSPFHWMAKIVRGPIVHDIARLGTVVAALKETLAGAGCCAIQLAPRVRGRDVAMAAETIRIEAGVPLPLSQQSLHVSTGIVWLDKPEADILAGFKQRARRQLRKAEASGQIVRVADPDDPADVALYQNLLDSFYAAKPLYASRDLPDAVAQAGLVKRLGGALLIAETDGVPTGGHCFIRQADEAIWLSMPTVDPGAPVPRAYGLLWEAMRTARAMGCVGFDLAGLPLEIALDENASGRLQFKRSFNPHRRIMVPVNSIVLKPAAHGLLFNARRAAVSVRNQLIRTRQQWA